jgi:4-carboxymuconolactone decarboxylase
VAKPFQFRRFFRKPLLPGFSNKNIMKNIKFKIVLLLMLCGFRSIAQFPNQMLPTIFPAGDKIQGGNFTGTVWVTPLLPADTTLNAAVGNVVFEPQARSKWHKHPGGQTLLALEGIGYYQEKDKPLQILQKGDVVRCPPGVEHWHGASNDHWFVQLAITPEHTDGRVTWLHEVSEAVYQLGVIQQQEVLTSLNDLDKRHQQIVAISSFTTKGDLSQLKKALHAGLDAGLTVNEIKEVLVHLYAYCGFPRSIQGLNTLMEVLETRKLQGIIDETGKKASAVTDTLSKYERGKKVLEALTGQPQITPPVAGYGAFSPETDVFLKEHLFADIFGRDILSYTDREIATISALVNLGGVEPMMKGHMGIALNLGMTEAQLLHLLAIIEANTGKAAADKGRKVLSEVIKK